MYRVYIIYYKKRHKKVHYKQPCFKTINDIFHRIAKLMWMQCFVTSNVHVNIDLSFGTILPVHHDISPSLSSIYIFIPVWWCLRGSGCLLHIYHPWSDLCLRDAIITSINPIRRIGSRNRLNLQTLRMLYVCFVYPYLDYCIEVWGDSCKIYMQTLLNLQIKVMRVITNFSWNACVDLLFTIKKSWK